MKEEQRWNKKEQFESEKEKKKRKKIRNIELKIKEENGDNSKK